MLSILMPDPSFSMEKLWCSSTRMVLLPIILAMNVGALMGVVKESVLVLSADQAGTLAFSS